MTVRGESWRNSARTTSRNSAPMDNLNTLLNAGNYSVMYQYCKNYRCKRVQALLVPSSNPRDSHPGAHILSLAKELDVPVLVFQHRTKDEFLRGKITIHRWNPGASEPISELTSWQAGARLLRQLQKDHESQSEDIQCGPLRYEEKWLEVSRVRGEGRLDLSLSNMIRCVPGVGHIDIDTALYCPQCLHVEAVIEASSDGMKGTSFQDKKKATSMSRHIAKILKTDTYLLQHFVNDDAHSHPTTLSHWVKTAKEPKTSEEMTWESLVSVFNHVHDEHLKVCQTEQEA